MENSVIEIDVTWTILGLMKISNEIVISAAMSSD